MSQSNLIMTVMSGLSAAQVQPFVCSFRAVAQPAAELVVFTSRVDDKTRTFLRQNATVVDFDLWTIRKRHPQCLLWPVAKPLFRLLKSERLRRKLAHEVFSLVFRRSLLYLDYLEKLSERPKWVFLTDCRDVIFQDDIFSRVSEPGLYCFVEGGNRKIGDCVYNSRMVRNCAGEEAVRELANCRISCSGTVLGDYANVVRYLQTMVDYAMTIRRMNMLSGDDQGAHNILLYRNKLPNLKLVDNDIGPVATVGCLSIEQIRRSPDHLILQSDDRPYAVAHQQDRHVDIVASHPAYRLVRCAAETTSL